MADHSEFRFFPWSRKGLVAETAVVQPDGSLPIRAELGVTIDAGAAGTPTVDLTLYGPGDVTGIDSRLIVRTDPRRNVTNVEPNYFAAIEFDPPDLPWALTPASANDEGKLRPWLVLICVERALVGVPTVTAGRPLPTITILGANVSTELPDLDESWAWAHTQVAKGEDEGPVTSAELTQKPAQNVSRIVSPRWLLARTDYVACLVPAFDAGVFRGLTGAQPTASTLGPAWDITSTTDVTLPVYYHWEFTTGVGGDFEELARKLRPFECPPTVGGRPIFVGDPGSGITTAAGAQGRVVEMEGALRSVQREPGSLADLAPGIQAGLRRAVDAPADHGDGGASDETPSIGPPLYGGRHGNAARVPPGTSSWLSQLNLDPRHRLAASLGTDIVQANQEIFMQEAWEQVEQVISANQKLSQAALAKAALRRLHKRHFVALSPSRLTQLIAPAATRLAIGELTVKATVARTSLPNAAVSGAMRRFTSGHRRAVRRAARRAGVSTTLGGGAPAVLIESLIAGRADVDPHNHGLAGLGTFTQLTDLKIPKNGELDLGTIGLPLAVSSDRARISVELFTGEIAKKPFKTLKVRPDLAASGMLSSAHLKGFFDSGEFKLNDLHKTLDQVFVFTKANPGNLGSVVTVVGPNLVVETLVLDSPTTVIAVDGNRNQRHVAEFESPVIHEKTSTLSRILVGSSFDLGSDTIAARRFGPGAGRGPVGPGRPDGRPRPVVKPKPGRAPRPGPVIQPGVGGIKLPPLVIDAEPIQRFKTAFGQAAPVLKRDFNLKPAKVVPFKVETAMAEVLARTDPVVTVARRLDSMITLGGKVPSSISPFKDRFNGLSITDRHDRILVGPTIDTPLFTYLADRHPDRFLPGVQEIPANAITVVETNPAFIESFLVGANHEMSRELLWRGYPGEPRATNFHHFWQWLDGRADIADIHSWPATSTIGSNTRGEGSAGKIVLLVRGELLRRYPNAVVYAWKGIKSGNTTELREPPEDDDLREPVFAGRFEPDYSFVGFDLDETALEDDPWFFVLQEQPTEPRFGLDDGTTKDLADLTTTNDLAWQHSGTTQGQYLRLSRTLASAEIGSVKPARNSAHLAAATLQRPARVAVLSTDVVSLKDQPQLPTRFAGLFTGHLRRETHLERLELDG